MGRSSVSSHSTNVVLITVAAVCEAARWVLVPPHPDAQLEFALFTAEATAIILLARKLRLSKQDAERRLAAAEEARHAAEDADRAKQEILARVAHEWRGPLATMSNWLWQLERRPADVRLVEQATVSLRRTLVAQRRLISDLLDYSRGSSGKLVIEFNQLAIGEVIARSVEAVTPEAHKKEIELAVSGTDDANLVSGDAVRLEQVFTNLLDNATKFTPPGGRISVSLVRRGDAVEVNVADTGVGIAAAALPEIFHPFHQAHRSRDARRGGLGLGLSIAREIVELHGGSLMASSSGPNNGSVFTVVVPKLAVDDEARSMFSTSTQVACGREASRRS